MKYLTYEDCGVDIIREPFNRSNKFSIVILVGGHGQVGKTTFEFYYANRICQLRKYGYRALDPFASCNTWKEWDAYNLTALTPQDFVRLWNNNHDKVLALAEASTKLYYMDWFNIMARVFTSSTTVLGKQHNICILDTVMESELNQKARDKIDFRVEVHRRDDVNKRAFIRSGKTIVDYLGMKWMLIRNNTWIVQYSDLFLIEAKKYTDWIAQTLKQQEAEENERRVGLIEPCEDATRRKEVPPGIIEP